jgi:signal transduction histidine kinase
VVSGRRGPHVTSITSDHDQLMRVLTNLISNAIKYSPGGSTVTVTLEGLSSAVRLAVADEGPGIPAAQLPRLFRPFSRLGAEGRSQDGTGLGLAISRALVEQLDGRIWAEPAWPTGARFVVELPTSLRAAPSSDAGAVAGLR